MRHVPIGDLEPKGDAKQKKALITECFFFALHPGFGTWHLRGFDFLFFEVMGQLGSQAGNCLGVQLRNP